MKELSVFIDESGDFGAYAPHPPYYIITMVFHDQEEDIHGAVWDLDRKLSGVGLDNLCIHTGPIIRKEEIYANMSLSERRSIFNKMVAFVRAINIRYRCFSIEKKQVSDVVDASGRLSKQISQFIHEHYQDFLAFDAVKVYYDNGQVEVSKILSSVFHALLPNTEFRRVMPEDYKLFQVTEEYAQPTNLLELTWDEYRTLEPFLLALGIRTRTTMWEGKTVTIQAENPYKAWIAREDRTFADEDMSEKAISVYKR